MFYRLQEDKEELLASETDAYVTHPNPTKNSLAFWVVSVALQPLRAY